MAAFVLMMAAVENACRDRWLEPFSSSTPRDAKGSLIKTSGLVPFFSERESPYKDPMPLVLCKRGELSARRAATKL